uniref:Putative secreted protein n=1 Tax=Anopheles marajoara TaxID=58244 RepID=A0A2M4CA70_9DIPT
MMYSRAGWCAARVCLLQMGSKLFSWCVLAAYHVHFIASSPPSLIVSDQICHRVTRFCQRGTSSSSPSPAAVRCEGLLFRRHLFKCSI